MGHVFRLLRPALLILAVTGALGTSGVTAQNGQALPAPTGTGLIAGQVLDVDSGQPVGGATVILRGSELTDGGRQRSSQVIADSQGRFYFGALPANTYLVTPQRSGYSTLPSTFRPIPLKRGGPMS